MSGDHSDPDRRDSAELDLFGVPNPDQQGDGEEDQEHESAPPPTDNLFCFTQSEQAVVHEVNGIVRGLLKRPDITPRKITALGKLLFGLERLPRVTPELNVVVTLIFRFNHESSYQSVSLSDDSFSLTSGGTVYDPAVGGDNYSSTTFEVGAGWRGDVGDLFEVSGWFDSFRERAASPEYELEIGDYDEEGMNWDIADEEDTQDAWRLLPDDGDL